MVSLNSTLLEIMPKILRIGNEINLELQYFFMKNLTRLFTLVVMVVFIGCGTTGGGFSGGASGKGSQSKLSDADFKRMGITHGGYGNSN
jgi:hypothetical protein